LKEFLRAQALVKTKALIRIQNETELRGKPAVSERFHASSRKTWLAWTIL
jgi:hypothetical protein